MVGGLETITKKAPTEIKDNKRTNMTVAKMMGSAS